MPEEPSTPPASPPATPPATPPAPPPPPGQLDVVERTKNFVKAQVLSGTLAGYQLVEGGAEQLAQLWGHEFSAVEAGESWALLARDGRAAAEVIKERLADPKYAHFLQAASRGGMGGIAMGGGALPTSLPDTGNYASASDAFIAQWNRAKAQTQSQMPMWMIPVGRRGR